MNKNWKGLQQRFQGCWTWWSIKTAQLKIEFLILAGILLFLLIAFSSYSMGRMALAPADPNKIADVSQEEHNKQIIPVLSGICITLATLYLSAIHIRIKESEKNRLLVTILVPQTDLEYLALMTDSLNDIPDKISGLDKNIQSISGEMGKRRFEEFLAESKTDYLNRQQAVAELNQALESNLRSPLGFLSMLRTACDTVLNQNGVKDIFTQETFRKCIYAYIRAWLVCSIQHNRTRKNKNSLRIDSIFYQDPNIENPNIKNMYQQAITELIDRLGHKPADKIFRSKTSRTIIKQYLGELIQLIEDMKPEKTQLTEQKSYPTEPPT